MALELKYFVLKPNGTSIHARASRAALRAYAATLRQLNRADTELASDLEAWADFGDEEVARITDHRRRSHESGKSESQGNDQEQQAAQGKEAAESRSRRWAEGGPTGLRNPQSSGGQQEAEPRPPREGSGPANSQGRGEGSGGKT